MRNRRISMVISLCGLLFLASSMISQAANLEARLRRPIAIQLSPDERFLYVANSRSGSISTVDLSSAATVHEQDVGQSLSDMKASPDGKRLLITDDKKNELIIATLQETGLSVDQRLAVATHPVSINISKDGRFAVVASLWSRRISIVDLSTPEPGSARVAAVIDLPFAPRCQILVADDNQLVVADAFGSRLAVVDIQARRLLHVRTFPSHNIRGLALSPNGTMLLVVHQMLNELAHTTNNDVHWGLLMSNDLRWLPLASVLSPTADLYRNAHMHPLGSAGNATGDPSGVAVTAEGTVVVSLGGVGEAAIGTENDFSLHRVGVGRRPTAVVANRIGDRAYFANTLADSISIVDLKKREAIQQISLGPSAELSLADRGEMLFYDATLSHDSWMSCHSCHTDGHANSLLNDNFSDKSFGAPKRVLSLLGVADTAPFAWNGQAPTLETQIRNSISTTMQGDEEPTERQLNALVSYLRTLSLPPSLDAARGTLDVAAAQRGEQLFESLKCNQCHAAPAYTTAQTYDVAIHDKQGNTHFNPPSLRGVSQRGPFFHDNRAENLEAVFRDVGHQLDRDLTDAELRDLLAFLNSL
jgi:DNA-binding beta-propeller fold protein YncE